MANMEKSVTEILKQLESGEDVVIKCSNCGDLIELKAECCQDSEKEFQALFPGSKVDDSCNIICDECFQDMIDHLTKNN